MTCPESSARKSRNLGNGGGWGDSPAGLSHPGKSCTLRNPLFEILLAWCVSCTPSFRRLSFWGGRVVNNSQGTRLFPGDTGPALTSSLPQE